MRSIAGLMSTKQVSSALGKAHAALLWRLKRARHIEDLRGWTDPHERAMWHHPPCLPRLLLPCLTHELSHRWASKRPVQRCLRGWSKRGGGDRGGEGRRREERRGEERRGEARGETREKNGNEIEGGNGRGGDMGTDERGCKEQTRCGPPRT